MNRQRLVIIIASGLIGLFILLQVFQLVGRVGKTAVVVVAIPKDSTIKVDGHKSKTGTIYVSPATHTFSAEKSGFDTATKTLDVGHNKQTINLIPQPASDEAKKWLQSDTAAQTALQSLGDQEASRINQELSDRNPIISRLPLGYNQQEFAIDYRQADNDPTRIVLQITGKTPTSRQYALQQIREWGYDPADYQIEFDDFTNPFSKGE